MWSVALVGLAVLTLPGRFTLDRPAAPLRDADGEVVVVYKFGYIVWVNALTIDVHTPARTDVPPPVPQKRPDPRVPSQITLTPFPKGGNRAWHFWMLDFVAEADGHQDRRPKFWNAIRLEREAGLREREEFCRNRTDCD